MFEIETVVAEVSLVVCRVQKLREVGSAVLFAKRLELLAV